MQAKQITKFLDSQKIEYLQNETFKNYCIYGVGGKIKLLILPFNAAELVKVLEFLGTTKYFVLGAGSKILPPDKTFKTPVIKLSGEFEGFTLTQLESGELVLNAGAGATVAALLNYCKVNGLSGLEFLQGIPASVGGIVYMNASAYLGETKNAINSVEAAQQTNNGIEFKTFSASECNFGYRTSVFQKNGAIIVSASFKVTKTTAIEVVKKCEQVLALRKHHAKGRSCGSVFKKPSLNAESAGKLIDECGLKGLKYKKAMVSPVHANFIINTGGAKSKHIKKLVSACEKAVYNKFKINLTKEVIYLEEENGRKQKSV